MTWTGHAILAWLAVDEAIERHTLTNRLDAWPGESRTRVVGVSGTDLKRFAELRLGAVPSHR